MSNTVITNYTDLNGPSTKTDSSVVVIVNKDGSLSVDQNLLGTLMGTDGSQAAGISVVRVGHEGRPDDATDSENEDDKVPHVTLSVDSYYNEPASIIKYDSGAEMLQSLRIETRENSLVGFQNDHCYTPLTSPSQILPQRSDSFAAYDDPVIEITHTPPPKPVSTPKKITILEQQIIPKGKKIILNSSEPSIILKGNDILTKPLPVLMKSKLSDLEKSKVETKTDENVESSSVSSSGDSTADRDSDSDYKEAKDKAGPLKLRKVKSKPRILKMMPSTRTAKIDPKITSRLKANKNLIKRDIKEKLLNKNFILDRKSELDPNKDIQNLTNAVSVSSPTIIDQSKMTPKSVSKVVKKDKKTPAHMTALLTDMTSLFSTPDVIRRVSTENKVPTKMDKEPLLLNKTLNDIAKPIKPIESRMSQPTGTEELKAIISQKPLLKQTKIPTCTPKSYDPIPQLDDASLAQILQDTPQLIKVQPSISAHVINSPGLAGPLSPTLDLLGGLQPEEDGLTEDLLMHVAQLVESSENLQEVIDKQVLGKVDIPAKASVASPFQQSTTSSELYTPPQKALKAIVQRKDPIEIVRRDGRVITLPPIEAPATRSSKRKTLVETPTIEPQPALGSSTPTHPASVTPEPLIQQISKQYTNKRLAPKKQEQIIPTSTVDKMSAESQESWNSEDDPNRLWCICKQPHNNRFMICCDGCEDWFHGKCVNITKAMGQQMEDQGMEWRCPNCVKNAKGSAKGTNKVPIEQKDNVGVSTPPAITKELSSKTTCIVCKKSARASSIYCSDACILKHAQDSLGSPTAPKSDSTSGKNEKLASESRVIVYERKSGRLLAGPNAPTAENLKIWLQKNPTFEVVRPGTLSAIKPNVARKKNLQEPMKIQTTLNFARIPRKSSETPPLKSPIEPKEKPEKPLIFPKEEAKPAAPKTPTTPKTNPLQIIETPKSHKIVNEAKKLVRATTSKSLSQIEKAPSVSPSTSRRKDTPDRRSRMSSEDPIRENVRKALQEQISSRMAEYDGPKFSEDEIQDFANDTELELHELFNRDVGMKYKAKYRSLMFNIKDRKNLTLWEKICERVITPKQLVRFSPEELASQELAQWRDKEAKHQLELIKKSEIDLLAASKTYVLKTHKGEEVMETKESVSKELDPNVPVEDIVSALNDAVGDGGATEPRQVNKKEESQKKHTKKKDKENRRSSRKKDKQSKRDSEKRKSRSSRRKSDVKEKERRSSGRVQRKARSRSKSKEKSKTESREKSVSRERSRHRSRSRGKKRQSADHSRSWSRGRERSRSLRRSSRRSHSRDSAKRRRSRSKLRRSTDDKFKHRSKSQENITKSKNDSTDSDSIERPKSAMMKESHPEYDPHEPMITSAFSEEDLRKSREDVYEERYNREIAEYGSIDYENDPKTFLIDTNMALNPSKHVEKQDKTSAEAESDQEPTSTVEHSAPTVWNGCINMVDVARFYVAAHEVSGNAVELEEDLTPELDIVGRINPDTVWDYIAKMKRAGNKDIVILKLQAANDEEKMQYIALYSYLSSRNRLGVVKVANTAIVKDFYIVPVPANTSLPEILLPLDGPGLGEVKTHLLISIIIRQRKKRPAPNIPKDIIPAKVSRSRRGSRKKSYTPPLSPRRRTPAFPSAALSTSVKDKIAASLAAADDDEAYSPGSSSNSNSAPPPTLPPNTLRSKMEELNRQIEEQKQQILKMAQADSSGNCENEAYSPSRPLTPPAPVVPLDEIALPSNLQEILATIKQRSETAADVDMRTLPMP